MFDDYDNTDKCYRITHADGRTRDVTEQKLYEFYLFSHNGITRPFSDILHDLRNGKLIQGEDYDFDWKLGIEVHKGKLFIEPIGRVQKSAPSQSSSKGSNSSDSQCRHPNKYVNSAGGVRFWVCPSCKKDMGNA
jgi:hypothetical protein